MRRAVGGVEGQQLRLAVSTSLLVGEVSAMNCPVPS